MRLLEPLADPSAPLARRDPTAKLAAAILLTAILLGSVDPVTPAVAIALELSVVPFFGIRYAALARRAWPLLVSAAGVFAFTLIFTTQRGEERLLIALGLALRILAVALPGVIVVATTDPTDLADSLIQRLRVPPRYAIGALAALRLAPLLADEWESLTLARRARGLDAGHNPVARVRLFASTMFALLVGAIRRGTRLAAAMDARGFDSGVPRSVARPRRIGPADAVLVAGALTMAALALGASLATGAFRPLL